MLFPSKALTFVVGLALISETEFAREFMDDYQRLHWHKKSISFFTPLFVFRHRIGRLLVKISSTFWARYLHFLEVLVC